MRARILGAAHAGIPGRKFSGFRLVVKYLSVQSSQQQERHIKGGAFAGCGKKPICKIIILGQTATKDGKKLVIQGGRGCAEAGLGLKAGHELGLPLRNLAGFGAWWH